MFASALGSNPVLSNCSHYRIGGGLVLGSYQRPQPCHPPAGVEMGVLHCDRFIYRVSAVLDMVWTFYSWQNLTAYSWTA